MHKKPVRHSLQMNIKKKELLLTKHLRNPSDKETQQANLKQLKRYYMADALKTGRALKANAWKGVLEKDRIWFNKTKVSQKMNAKAKTFLSKFKKETSLFITKM